MVTQGCDVAQSHGHGGPFEAMGISGNSGQGFGIPRAFLFKAKQPLVDGIDMFPRRLNKTGEKFPDIGRQWGGFF